LPHWSVSIALEHKGQIVAGVVHDPVKDETFYAEKGLGAWLNDSRVRVSARHRLTDCLFGTGIPFGARPGLPETLQDLARLMPATAGVRRLGSAALDLAYVAAGRIDGFWERSLQPWDMAAGLLIVTEAGGFTGSIGEGKPMDTGDVIAANANVFESFAAVIRNRP
jgi:myo-inositol-1(or 4)-monophosphatase